MCLWICFALLARRARAAAHAIRSPPPADLASVGCDTHATIEGARQRLGRGVGLFWLVYMLGVRLFCVGLGAIFWSRFGYFNFSRLGFLLDFGVRLLHFWGGKDLDYICGAKF